MQYQLSKKFPGKRAFITGAASGLGLAFAELLAGDGWTLGLTDVNESALKSTASTLSARGSRILTYVFDVSDREAYKQAAESFLRECGGVDLLFNNAGVGDGGLFEEYSLDNWEWMIRINQLGVIYGCHFFLPTFKKQRFGHILNTASLAATSCAPSMGAYNVTKAAVVAISETLYGELLDYNVQVSCIQPSYFRTQIAEGVRGGEVVKKMTQFLVERSGIEANEIANEVLVRAGKGELYIVLPKIARRMWLMKRIAPMWFRHRVKEKFMAMASRFQ